MGNILVALYNDTPKHRDNFLKLVDSGYYDGCIFQRVIKNFMIQGGDYSCRKVNMKKPQKFDVNYTVPAEIIYPKYYHKRGQLCAAREGDDENPTKASASTDFYITWGRNFSPRQMEYYVEKQKREGKDYAIPSEQLQQGYIKHGGSVFSESDFSSLRRRWFIWRKTISMSVQSFAIVFGAKISIFIHMAKSRFTSLNADF